jgi:DNA-binding MarR family transcriptional regulator
MNDITKKKLEEKKKIKKIIGEILTRDEVNFAEFIGFNPYKTLSEISRELKKDYKNTHRICKNLYKKRIILLTPPPEESRRGVPVRASLNFYRNDEDGEHILLNLLIQNKGRMEERELMDKLNNYEDLISDPFGREKVAILINLLYKNNHIKREISITPEGKKFLEEISKKKVLKEKIKSLNSVKNK